MMTINTNLNTNPYFNDHDPDKNYQALLFKASTAVQARELNQLQTLLQEQIERFGDNILREGTIVKGGNFVDHSKVPFVKISDNNTSNQPIVIENYLGAKVTGKNSGVTAQVIYFAPGLETQSPDLNTLYVKYTSSGSDATGKDIKTFIAGEVLEFTVGNLLQPELSVTVASYGLDPTPMGHGYLVSCGDGIIFQKGYFVRFENQYTIVSKYSTKPSDLVVGFNTEESIVNANSDTTLFDNAQGYNNYNAPGADRLKLVPKLVTYNEVQASSDEHFFSIQEYQNGQLVRRNVTTQYNEISKMIEQRTAEESGNYVVRGLNASITSDTTNPLDLNVSISSGLGYVEGKRVETVGESTISLRKGDESGTVSQQNILANYGNYIVVDSMIGSFNVNNLNTISFYSLPQTDTSLSGYTVKGSKIGEARVLSVKREYADKYKIYLFDIRLSGATPFSQAKSISSASGFANMVLESGKAVIKDSSFKQLYFPVGKTFIKEIVSADTDYVARRYKEVTASTSGAFTITLSGNEVFPQGPGVTLNTDARNSLIIVDKNSGKNYTASSATIGAGGNTMTVNIGALPSSITVGVIYDVKISSVLPIGKELRTVYMRINPNGDTNGPYSLGWPDVYSIENIWKFNTDNFDENTPGIVSVKNNFTLNKNIKQDQYALSYLTKKGISISSSDRFLVKAKVFVKNISGGYSQSFFAVNSYPVDDVSVPLPANKIRTQNIPFYARNSIDFRPYVSARASYATTPASATTWTSSNKLDTVSFGTSDLNIISPNEYVETTYSYYMGRKDRVLIDERGEITLVEGVASENPSTPVKPNKGMTLAIVNVPPYPTLSMSSANRLGVSMYGTTVDAQSNRSYTMKDIEEIDQRISRIEYYTALNMLEKNAEDLVVKDADGNNRFKNGIVVDNYSDLLLCEVKSEDFKASVDRAESTMAPRQRQYEIGLKPMSSTNTKTNVNNVVTLNYTTTPVINQKFASKYRNCVTDFYNYAGSSEIFPEYDGAYDTTYAPDVTANVDIAGAFADFTENLNEIVPLKVTNTSSSTRLTGSQTSTSSSTARTAVRGANIDVTTTTTTTRNQLTTTTTAMSEALSQKNITKTQKVGDFITDIQFSPYLRGRIIRIATTGLRPNTTFYVFFDGQPMAKYVSMGRLKVDGDPKSMIRTSNWGVSLKSDARGDLNVLLNLPGETFYTGDREIMIIDVADMNSIEAATSASTVTYRGFNFSVEKTGLEIATRTPDFNIQRTKSVLKSVRTVTTTEVDTTTTLTATPVQPPRSRWRPSERSGDDGSRDPIAQTFTVSPGMSTDTSVFVTQVDAAFFKKSLINGITMEIRSVDNGYPSAMTLPFGRVKLRSSDVRVSSNGSAITSFKLKTPVALNTNKEYAIVFIPDGNDPDYLIWCSKTGEVDKVTNKKLTLDTNPGTLFTSTNNSAWTPYQDENLKFTIHKAVFNNSAGWQRLQNEDLEFFSLLSYSGKFSRGETAYVKKSSNLAGTISTQAGSNVITGIGTSFNTAFAVGRYIAILNTSTGKYEVSKIVEINGGSSMVLEEDMKVTQTGRTYYRTKAGIVNYFNTKEPAMLFLEESSAVTGDIFQSGDVIVGEISGAICEIEEVMDIPVSFIQPNIYRTNFSKTSTKMSMVRQSHATGGYNNPGLNIPFAETTHLTNASTVIRSRSNEIANYSGAKSFVIEIGFSTSSDSTSPTIDTDLCSVTATSYFINESTDEVLDSEKANGGLSDAKLVSKTITLADGMDAEDIKLWLTAYKPSGTTIDVFVKFSASEDSSDDDEIAWTKLNLDASKNFSSSSANRFDYKEFEYSLGNVILGNGEGAYLNNGSFEYKTKDGTVFDNYKNFSIKIVLGSSTHHIVPRLKDMRAIALT